MALPFDLIVDGEFPKRWPFGILKTLHWILPFLVMLPIWLWVDTYYGSVGVTMFFSILLFTYSLISWLIHLFGLQKKRLQIGNIIFMHPLIVDFVIGCIATLAMGIGSLIMILAFLFTIYNMYKFAIMLAYFLSTVFTMGTTASYGYFVVLVYRQCPNGNIRNLLEMHLEGSELRHLDVTDAGARSTTGGIGTTGTFGRPPV